MCPTVLRKCVHWHTLPKCARENSASGCTHHISNSIVNMMQREKHQLCDRSAPAQPCHPHKISLGTRFSKSARLVLTGLMLVASGVYAQEAAQNVAQRKEPQDQKQIENEARGKPLRDAGTLMKEGDP